MGKQYTNLRIVPIEEIFFEPFSARKSVPLRALQCRFVVFIFLWSDVKNKGIIKNLKYIRKKHVYRLIATLTCPFFPQKRKLLPFVYTKSKLLIIIIVNGLLFDSKRCQDSLQSRPNVVFWYKIVRQITKLEMR